jgi:hypothetical protein
LYDIIGDIHGHAEALEALLSILGYRQRQGAWRHPDRTALFVGDLIDRGPQQVETLTLVRSMLDAGAARIVLGNHEWNALLFATPDPDRPGGYLRPHTAKNRHQHAAFLAQVGEGSALHEECLRFFETIPLWLDLGALKLVHACWHPAMQARLEPALTEGALRREDLPLLARRGSETAAAADIVLKGLELALPDGVSFRDKDGHERREARVRWWLDPGASWRDAAILDAAARCALPDERIPDGLLLGRGSTPIFFGHYWMHGCPVLMSPRAACLDWSVAAGGVLAAYRFEGEQDLRPEAFVSIGSAI